MAEHRFLADLEDTRFVLFEHLRAQNLFELPAFSDFDAGDVDPLLSEAAKFAKEVLAPANAAGDRQGCQFEDGVVKAPQAFHEVYAKQGRSGWLGMTTDPEYGGHGLPFSVGLALGEMFAAANCSLSMLAGLTREAASLIIEYGTDEMRKKYVRPLVEGRWQGTMCLTEPHAGTAVGDIKTTAAKRDGKYYVRGQKIFISGGEHDLTQNIIHLVLARLEGAPAGTKGLSLFLVPKFFVDDNGELGERNDVVCTGIEEKLGIHGSPTCAMSFGENDQCVGELVGEENDGMRVMFEMMNGARVGVGLQGVAMGSWAYLTALDYARDRIQGVEMKNFRDPDAPRVPIVQHPDVQRMLATMRSYTEGGRALLLYTAMCIDLSKHAEDEQQREYYDRRVELLTPICKAYCSERGFETANLALQTFGGHGYLKDYPIEQILRDVRIAPIYEGTNGIQALDLLGRKIGREQGRLFMELIADVDKVLERVHKHEGLSEIGRRLSEAKDKLAQVTMSFASQQMSGDVDYPLLSASPYLRMMGNVAIAWLLAEQAEIAQRALDQLCEKQGAADDAARKKLCHEDAKARFYSDKIGTAAFFATNILTENLWLGASIDSGNRAPLEMQWQA